ncbi:hypothetical protein FOVSG1_011232 [Fusarium oxysporum f. sp. vasinfectum]
MPVSTLSCPPCRKAKKKCNLGDAGVQTPCQRCNEKGLQSECTGLELTEKAQARKRKLAATDIDNDKTCEYLPLEVFWLERLMKYSKSALTIHWETWDLLDREYYEPPKVVEVLKQIEENRALVGSRVKSCAKTPSLANSLDFLSKFSNTYYSWDTEREVKLGFQPHWFIGETETHSPNLGLTSKPTLPFMPSECKKVDSSRIRVYCQKNLSYQLMPRTIEEKDMFGRSLLHLALDLSVGDDAVHLLSSAANEPDAWGRLPLHIASFTGCIDLTTRLIYDQTEIQMEDNCGLQPLHYASAAGHVDIVNLLIGKAEIDPEDSHGRTPLIYGVMNGHIATASVLLENGADIESYEWSWTPLLYAINGGRVGIVDLLLRKGADVEPMMETETFMSHPLRRKHLGVIELLLERGAVEEIRRFSDENLLLWAANKGHHRLIRQLIFHKEFQTPISTNGITALSYASEEGNHEIVVELLENGVDPNKRCNGRELPLSYAVARGHVNVTKELLKHDANPNAKSGIDMDGQMILVNAFELRNPDIIDHLVAWGADVSANGSRG